jgi:RES domain
MRVVPAGVLLWRLYFRGGRHPTAWNTFRAFGPTRGRFDHQLPPPRVQERRILYAAGHGPTALAEVFQEGRTVDRTTRDPWLAAFHLRRPISLLDLSGIWPTRAGASMALSSGPRPRAQRWSRAFYEAYPGIDGLFYPSSMSGSRPALAFYERALDALPRTPELHRPLLDPALLPILRRVASDLGYGLA